MASIARASTDKDDIKLSNIFSGSDAEVDVKGFNNDVSQTNNKASANDRDTKPSEVFAGWDSNVDVQTFNEIVSETHNRSKSSAKLGHPPDDKSLVNNRQDNTEEIRKLAKNNVAKALKVETVFFDWEVSEKEFQSSAEKITAKTTTNPINDQAATPQWKRDLQHHRKGREDEFQ